MTTNFKTTVFAKCILAGEHAVLRGHPAIIFPVKSKNLHLTYSATNHEIQIEFFGAYAEALRPAFLGALEQAIEILGIQRYQLCGKLLIENNIKIGAGMGGSAATCVAIARWLQHLGFILETNLFEFARQLENLFHGESSGADIAAAIAGTGIYYSRNDYIHPIKQSWKPKWYLSFSGKSSATFECVNKVKKMWEVNPKAAAEIDVQMAESVSLIEQALAENNDFSLSNLAAGIDQGYACFKAWSLCDGIVEDQIKQLKSAGALAAKPTGAGAGGYILSLWESEPPKAFNEGLIAL